MLIRMTAGLSGPAYSLGPGDERDFPQDEAIRLVDAGYAVPVARASIEVATKAPGPESRVEPIVAHVTKIRGRSKKGR
jgi:hypothetical protein